MVTPIGAVADGSADVVVVSIVSVQQGGGPVVSTGGTSSWKDVAISVGSVGLFEVGRSIGAVDDDASIGETPDDPIAIALSSRSKCLEIS